MGLSRAGFDVTGVDIEPQPRYPFRFVQGDALRPPFDLTQFDFIWASPKCQHHTRVWLGQEHKREKYPNQIPATRALLAAAGVMSCIENVIGAPLRPDLVLTGAQFDLDIVRDRVFELHGFTVPFMLAPRHSRTVSNGDLACVAGRGTNNAWNVRRKRGPFTKWRHLPEDLKKRLRDRNCVAGWRAAMQIEWMTRDELAQAVPPAYSEFIGRAAIAALDQARRREAPNSAPLDESAARQRRPDPASPLLSTTE